MKNLSYLLLFLSFALLYTSCGSDNSAEIEALKTKLAEAEKKAAEMQSPATPELIHSVFFWLKEDLTEEQKASFNKAVQSLSEIKHIQTFYMGPPAKTAERGVVDNSYSVALICQFAKPEDQDAYQVDPIHLKFVEENKEMWTKVVVYDNLVE